MKKTKIEITLAKTETTLDMVDKFFILLLQIDYEIYCNLTHQNSIDKENFFELKKDILEVYESFSVIKKSRFILEILPLIKNEIIFNEILDIEKMHSIIFKVKYKKPGGVRWKVDL